MSKSMKIRLGIFLVLSFFICGALISQIKITEPAIKLTLSGRTAQPFDYFSADFQYNQRQPYPGGNSFTTLTYKLNPEKQAMGHRFDFGSIPGETIVVSSIILETPKFHRYVLDLDRAKEWIKSTNQLKPVRILDHKLQIETTGNDGYLITKDNLFEHFARKELNISSRKIVNTAIIEFFLLAFLLLFPWIAKGVIICGRVIFTRKFLIQTGIFAAVNLFIILPAAYFFCRNLPDVFSITVKAKESFLFDIYYKTPYSERFKRSMLYSEENQYQTINIPLTADAEKDRIRLDLGSQPQAISIKSISIIRYGLFRSSVNLGHAPEIFTSRNHIDQFKYQNGRLDLTTCGNDPFIVPDPVKYTACQSSGLQFGPLLQYIAGAEILLLLLLSQSLCNLILKISPVKLSNKENLLLSLSTAGAFAFILALSLPLHTFKMAEEIIQFKMNLLVHFLCILAPAVFVVLAATLYFLNKRCGAFFTILAAAVTTLFAVECGLLSFNLPELDGNFDAYYNVPRMILHIAVWLIGIILPLCFQKKIYSWIPLALLIVCIMNGASLIDALMKKNPLEERGKLIVKSTVNYDGTIDRVKYARKNNVIMICLDAVTSEAVCKVFEEYPELKKHYPGFTFFTNNIGMNVATMWAVPGFFTGKIITPEVPTSEYTVGMYSKESALKQYIDRKYAIFSRISLPSLSYIYPDSETINKVSLLTPLEGTMLQWQFHELYLFKIVPFFLKGQLMRHYFYDVWPNRQKSHMADFNPVAIGNPDAIVVRDENYIYKKLAEAPLLGPEFPGAFHYHHFYGAHPPFIFDRNGNRVKHQNSWEGYYDCIVFEMKRVAKYLDALQQRGLYDDSVIIVCADHGLEYTLRKNDIHPRLRPLLMIKCRNSKSSLEFCDLPASHVKIAPFLKSDDIFAIKQIDVPKFFYTKVRQFAVHRQQIFSIDQNQKILSVKKTINKSSMNKIITLDFHYSLSNFCNSQFPPILYNSLIDQITGLSLNNSIPASLQFFVPDKTASYQVVIDAVLRAEPKDNISVKVNSKSGSEYDFHLGKRKILLKKVRPDADGIIQINFKRQGDSGVLFLTGLLVNKE